MAVSSDCASSGCVGLGKAGENRAELRATQDEVSYGRSKRSFPVRLTRREACMVYLRGSMEAVIWPGAVFSSGSDKDSCMDELGVTSTPRH